MSTKFKWKYNNKFSSKKINFKHFNINIIVSTAFNFFIKSGETAL